MNQSFSEDSRRAVDRYQALLRKYPSLLDRPSDFPYQIVCDPQAMLDFASEKGVLLGLHSETPYTYLIVDLVEKPNPDGGPALRFPYQRLLHRAQLEGNRGVVVVAVNDCPDLGELGSIFFVQQSRHPTGSCHLELVRGFGEPGLSVEENACKELREECGLIGSSARPMGTIFIDTGLSHAEIAVVLVQVQRRLAENEPEESEAAGPFVLLSEEEVRQAIGQGRIQDSMTIAGAARYLWRSA